MEKACTESRTTDLLDPNLSNEQLAMRVERFSDKPMCDGISIDNAGNIYISDLQANAIGVITPDRHYEKLITDPRISWPESFSFGAGRVALLCSQPVALVRTASWRQEWS